MNNSYDIISSCNPRQENIQLLDDHVRIYLSKSMMKNKISPKARKEFVDKIILSTQLVADQAEAIIKSSTEIKQNDITSINAGDALGHLGLEYQLIVDEIDTIVDSMKRFKSMF